MFWKTFNTWLIDLFLQLSSMRAVYRQYQLFTQNRYSLRAKKISHVFQNVFFQSKHFIHNSYENYFGKKARAEEKPIWKTYSQITKLSALQCSWVVWCQMYEPHIQLFEFKNSLRSWIVCCLVLDKEHSVLKVDNQPPKFDHI